MGISGSIDLKPADRKLLDRLLERFLPEAEIWAFGSRVKWTAKPNSDLDLAAFTSEKNRVSNLKEALEESDLSIEVDLHIWDNLPENFQRNIKENYAILKEKKERSEMKDDWINKSLGDLGRIVTGKTPSSKIDDAFKGITPFITPRDMDGRKWIRSTERCLSEIGVDAVKGSLVPKRSVAVSCIGSDMGKAVLVDRDSVTNQQINTIVPDEEINNAEYLYYELSTRQDELKGLAGGSATPILSKTLFSKVPIRVPSKDVQDRIAGILSPLDDKIELNRRMNRTLEAMAQAIFKSWFVDFEPVRAKAAAKAAKAAKAAGASPAAIERAAIAAIAGKTEAELDQLPEPQQHSLAQTAALFPDTFQDSELGEIPKGWKTGKLSDAIKLIGGGTPKKSQPAYWDGDIPWFSVKDAPNESDVYVLETELKITKRGLKESSTKLLEPGTTIITARGTVGRLALVGQPMAMNQSCYGVVGANEFPAIFTYFNLRNAVETLQQNTHAAVFDTITQSTFQTVDQTIPANEVVEKFETLVEPILSQIKTNGHQSNTLAQLRDTLLPKLLSGELTVPEAQSQTEEALA